MTIDQLTDDALLVRARADAQAFAAFYRRHAAPLAGYFLRRTGNAEVAADLTAETFAAALAGIKRFEPDRGPAAGWLYGIARRQVADYFDRGAVEERGRRRLKMDRLELADEALERVEATADVAVLAVAEQLDTLPAPQRAAVAARIVDERPYAEIAAETGVSEQVVRQRVARGLAGLRALVRKVES